MSVLDDFLPVCAFNCASGRGTKHVYPIAYSYASTHPGPLCDHCRNRVREYVEYLKRSNTAAPNIIRWQHVIDTAPQGRPARTQPVNTAEMLQAVKNLLNKERLS